MVYLVSCWTTSLSSAFPLAFADCGVVFRYYCPCQFLRRVVEDFDLGVTLQLNTYLWILYINAYFLCVSPVVLYTEIGALSCRGSRSHDDEALFTRLRDTRADSRSLRYPFWAHSIPLSRSSSNLLAVVIATYQSTQSRSANSVQYWV